MIQVNNLIQLLQSQNQQASVMIEIDSTEADVHGILHYNDESGNPIVVITGDVATMRPLNKLAKPV